MHMSKNDQTTFLDPFFQQKKPVFQTIGRWGSLFTATALGVLIVAFVVGITLYLSRGSDVSITFQSGSGFVRSYQSGRCPFGILMGMLSLWGCLCLNLVLAHRLFCAYKKGKVFNATNNIYLIGLGLLNIFLCSAAIGIFCLALSIVLPNKDPS
jgi:hypothetical protein